MENRLEQIGWDQILVVSITTQRGSVGVRKFEQGNNVVKTVSGGRRCAQM